jgi:hypothetical protein
MDPRPGATPGCLLSWSSGGNLRVQPCPPAIIVNHQDTQPRDIHFGCKSKGFIWGKSTSQNASNCMTSRRVLKERATVRVGNQQPASVLGQTAFLLLDVECKWHRATSCIQRQLLCNVLCKQAYCRSLQPHEYFAAEDLQP